MNIREHIEAGHYPKDDKGRALVPMRDRADTLVVCATDGSGNLPIVGFPLSGRTTCGRCFYADSEFLLPPPPRKARMTAWAVLASGMPGAPDKYIVHLCKTEEEAARWGCHAQQRIELTGEYEESWT